MRNTWITGRFRFGHPCLLGPLHGRAKDESSGPRAGSNAGLNSTFQGQPLLSCGICVKNLAKRTWSIINMPLSVNDIGSSELEMSDRQWRVVMGLVSTCCECPQFDEGYVEAKRLWSRQIQVASCGFYDFDFSAVSGRLLDVEVFILNVRALMQYVERLTEVELRDVLNNSFKPPGVVFGCKNKQFALEALNVFLSAFVSWKRQLTQSQNDDK
jgi:hypothetical protein